MTCPEMVFRKNETWSRHILLSEIGYSTRYIYVGTSSHDSCEPTFLLSSTILSTIESLLHARRDAFHVF